MFLFSPSSVLLTTTAICVLVPLCSDTTCWVDVWPGHHLPRSFQYHAMQQEERRNKTKGKTIKIRGSATKGLASTGHANFTMKKKFYKRRPHPQPLYTQFSLTRSFPHKSSLSLGRPSEPLKCLATTAQEPPAPSLSALPPLSSLEFRTSFVRCKNLNHTPSLLPISPI